MASPGLSLEVPRRSYHGSGQWHLPLDEGLTRITQGYPSAKYLRHSGVTFIESGGWVLQDGPGGACGRLEGGVEDGLLGP